MKTGHIFHAIAVHPGLYVAGTAGGDEYFARMWKNGQVLYELTDRGGKGTSASSMAVQGGNIHTCGVSTHGQNSQVMVWKSDRALHILTTGKP